MANNEKQARVYRDAVINGAGKELKQTLVDKQSELPRSNSDEFKSTNSSDSLTSVGTIFFDTSSYKSDLIVTSNHSEYPNRIFRVGSSDDVDEGKTFTKRDSPEGSPRKCVSPQAEPSSPRDRSMNDRDFKPGCLDRPASADFTRNAASDQDIFNYPMDLPGERPSSFPSTHVPPDFVSDTSSVASSCHGSPGITPSITPASSFENLLCLYDGKQNRVMCSAAQHIEKSASERSSHRMNISDQFAELNSDEMNTLRTNIIASDDWKKLASKQNREIHDMQKRQKEETDQFLEKAIRQCQKAVALQENNQPQEGKATLSENSKEPQSSSHQHLVSRQLSNENAQMGNLMKSAKISDDKKLNELTLKQLDSMSRPNRSKNSMNMKMIQPKNDPRAARPSLNQLKQLNQQQQMVTPIFKENNSSATADKRREPIAEKQRGGQNVTTTVGGTTGSNTRTTGSHVSQQQQQQQHQRQQFQQNYQAPRDQNVTTTVDGTATSNTRSSGAQHVTQQQFQQPNYQQPNYQPPREQNFTQQQQQQQWQQVTTAHGSSMQGSMVASNSAIQPFTTNSMQNSSYKSTVVQSGHVDAGSAMKQTESAPATGNWWMPQADASASSTADSSKMKYAPTASQPVTCAAMGSYVSATPLPATQMPGSQSGTQLPVTCSAQSRKSVTTTQGSALTSGAIYSSSQISNVRYQNN